MADVIYYGENDALERMHFNIPFYVCDSLNRQDGFGHVIVIPRDWDRIKQESSNGRAYYLCVPRNGKSDERGYLDCVRERITRQKT